ncbi:ABC transporter substrate-binding protein [Aureibacillus halotolerans]|uniref:Carbohydrate ABC transporter substrate-binding protein (CUT1 family) n=1 Tax=Aureibacillus halotolerans TaxID=1508390 RepID=A0A4R6TUJ7_9BACI|nr:ABC transporter substrate-binding protein [Aureibacillus halotolerans]TDQ36272.1 carbohydrate ABC transporter substrate-binding protein (CUT1 family) [Aureibacillus halotolerans]
MKRWKMASVTMGLVLAVAGCSGGGENVSQDQTEGPQESTTGTDAVTFSYFQADPNPNWTDMEDQLGKVITEETGVTIDAEYGIGDDKEKIALIAASGEYPDLIAPKGNTVLVEAGAMVNLEPLIREHAPNIMKMLDGDLSRLRYSNDDQSIYYIPIINTVGHTRFDAGGMFNLQHDVVRDLGFPEIRTVKDYENAIREYKEKHPQIDGQDTIGLSLLADDWRIMISVTNPAFIATGAPDDGEYYIDPETYEATFHYRRPEEKEYFRWLNHMNDSGLLDPESFVQTYEQYLSKVSSGRVLGIIDADWDYSQAEDALKAAGKFERTYGHYPVTLTEEYVDKQFQPTGFMGGWGVGITTACADPVRAIKFLDYLASDEGQVLINWGIEGEHYEVVDGVRTIPADVQERKTNDATAFIQETGIGNYSLSLRYGDGVKDDTGNYYTTNFPELITENYSDPAKEVLAAYGVDTWKGLFPSEEDLDVKPWGAAWDIPIPTGDELNVLFQRSQDIVRKRIPEIILADPSEFDQKWDAFMGDLDAMGIEKMEDMYTEHVKARVELWGN